MSIRFLSAAAVVFAAGHAALAQVDEAAKQKLQAMADAVKQAGSITYSSVNKGSGGFFSMLPEYRGDVAMLRDPQSKEWRIRYSGTRAAAAGQSAMDFIVVANGKTRTWIDDAAKKVIERPNWNSETVEQVTSAHQVAVRELSQPNPFEKDLTAATITLEAQADVNGVPCDVVLVDPGQQQPQFRYYIATTDKLPRKVEQILGEMGSQGWTLTNVQLNAPITESLFKVDVPTGYTFVPAAPPPAPRPTTSSDGTVAPAGPKARTVGVEQDNLAPDFSLTDANGEQFSLAQSRDNVIVLDFWGTWCLPCRKASPGLQRLHEKYQDQPVKILGLAVREANDDNPKNYMKQGNYTYGLLLKADDVAKQYKVRVFPTYFVIGKEGQIVHISSGYTEETIPQLEEAIEIALGRKQPKAPARPAAPAAQTGEDGAAQPAAPARKEAEGAGDASGDSPGGGDRSPKREAPRRK